MAVAIAGAGLYSDVGPLSFISCAVVNAERALRGNRLTKVTSEDAAGLAAVRGSLDRKSKLGVTLFFPPSMAHIETVDGVVKDRVPVRCYFSASAKQQGL